MGKLIFLTGPVRSGKSRRAVELARAWGDDVVFVATYRETGDDSEMTERVRRHRAERPAWRTLEAPTKLAETLGMMWPAPTGVVLDCLTLWLGDRFAATDEAIVAAWDEELVRAKTSAWPMIVVGNEVGWSLVPESAQLRRFRDLAGTLSQRTAAAADDAWLCVAGCAMRLK